MSSSKRLTLAVLTVMGLTLYTVLDSDHEFKSQVKLVESDNTQPTANAATPPSSKHQVSSISVSSPSKITTPPVIAEPQVAVDLPTHYDDDDEVFEEPEKIFEQDQELVKQIDQTIRKQLEEDYGDFFISAMISGENQAKLASIFVENKKHQQNLFSMLFDQGSTLDEVLEHQEYLATEQRTKLAAVLNPEQMHALDQYEKELPEQNYRRQIRSLFKDNNLSSQSYAQIENVFVEEERRDYQEGRSFDFMQKNHTLNLKIDELQALSDFKDNMQEDYTSTVRFSLQNEEQRLLRILDRLPNDLHDDVREKAEESMNKTRQILEALTNQDRD